MWDSPNNSSPVYEKFMWCKVTFNTINRISVEALVHYEYVKLKVQTCNEQVLLLQFIHVSRNAIEMSGLLPNIGQVVSTLIGEFPQCIRNQLYIHFYTQALSKGVIVTKLGQLA